MFNYIDLEPSFPILFVILAAAIVVVTAIEHGVYLAVPSIKSAVDLAIPSIKRMWGNLKKKILRA